MAEWLRSGLQNRVHRFNSGRHLQENQKLRFRFRFLVRCLDSFAERHLQTYPRMAELVYAADLKSAPLRVMGPSPIPGTTNKFKVTKNASGETHFSLFSFFILGDKLHLGGSSGGSQRQIRPNFLFLFYHKHNRRQY